MSNPNKQLIKETREFGKAMSDKYDNGEDFTDEELADLIHYVLLIPVFLSVLEIAVEPQ